MERFILVGGAVLRNNKILLLHLSLNHRYFPNQWGLPAGKVEIGEDPNVAIIRKVKEETNLECLIINPYNVWSQNLNKPDHQQIIQIDYLLKCENPSNIILQSTHQNYGWFAFDKLPTPMTPEIKNTITKAFDEINN